jgi:hypothetical protein
LNILEHCVPSVSITMYMCRHTHRMTWEGRIVRGFIICTPRCEF